MNENKLEVYSNAEFGAVRTLVIDGEPYFVGKDVATILGYTETAKAIREHIDDDDKGVSILDTPGGKQKITVINESGLYGLVLSSKMPKAAQRAERRAAFSLFMPCPPPRDWISGKKAFHRSSAARCAWDCSGRSP